MFKNIARTLAATLSSVFNKQQAAPKPLLNARGQEISARALTFHGRGKGGKSSSKKGNTAQLKRASKKASNIRKWG